MTVSWFKTSCQKNGNESASVKYIPRKYSNWRAVVTPIIQYSAVDDLTSCPQHDDDNIEEG